MNSQFHEPTLITYLKSPKLDDCNGSTVNVPGVPLSYDYEWCPSSVRFSSISMSNMLSSSMQLLLTMLPNLAAVVRSGQIYIREADGVVCVSANAFEPEAVTAVKEWFSSMKKPWYNVGPLSINANAVQVTEEDTLISTFLNRIQGEFGPKSLLYVGLLLEINYSFLRNLITITPIRCPLVHFAGLKNKIEFGLPSMD